MNLTRKEYINPAEKKKDFWLGVGLFFVLNIVLAVCIWGVFLLFGYSGIWFDGSTSTYSDIYTVLSCILSLLPWLINIGLIVYFSLTRGQIALGMLAGFGIAFVLTICLGLIFTAWCFYALSSGSLSF